MTASQRPTSWNPTVYQRYADERSRPYFDLVQRVRHDAPAEVVDLGCGTGVLTASLAQRWPTARITGLDSSSDMVAKQPSDLPSNVSVSLGDISDFDATGVDVVVSNAALQWVPEHRGLVAAWVSQLNAGGTLAFQVPGNFDAPSHVLMRELAATPEWSPIVGGVLRGTDSVDSAVQYASALQVAGARVDAWETSYVHVLTGEDPVLNWVRGTGLRPVLDVLDADQRSRFEERYAAMLREAYPSTPAGTLFPFRRIFVVAQKN
ncbi:trans-aconitate 2-methyltransferase [Rhodococcoides kyotonense]|uniref:Trans-aconitate 2-methyltransferase n=1 Tax=Rhodococcoides kyotonense TaxID=398843 RepID=A0A239GIB8_9NOCA|nr:trans-aconitate 2-methyltransferase [Rhodococcus kyotonensis]SNS68635.1 trans-aconitate 2-methyltransferase [Rhodococcus kyotonensis]